MTTEAFAQRGMERQELLAGLFRDLLVEEDRRGNDPTFFLELERAISEYLQQRRRNAPRHSIAKENGFFVERVFRPLNEFARSQEESDSLVAQLWIRVVESAALYFGVQIQKQEFADPALIFHAPSAMSEVPINGSS